MRLDDLQQECHELAVEKGFWEGERNIPECLALIHSEVSEALEEYRDGRMSLYYTADGKPEGFGIELADTVIRVLDLAEHYGWDLGYLIRMKLEFNKTRPHKHGKKA